MPSTDILVSGAEELAWGHPTGVWQNQELNPDSSAPDAVVLTTAMMRED